MRTASTDDVLKELHAKLLVTAVMVDWTLKAAREAPSMQAALARELEALTGTLQSAAAHLTSAA